MTLTLDIAVERWPIAGTFTIARGSKTEAVVVVARLTDGRFSGRGECVPYARYGETVEGVAEALTSMRRAVTDGLGRLELQAAMPAGAARNALDCAFWDLEAKRQAKPVWHIAGVPEPLPLATAYTLSLGEPDAMARAAAAQAFRPLLKVKLGTADDVARLRAVRSGAPHARLIVDANEGWRGETLALNLATCVETGVELIEQPLPARDDSALAGLARTIPICADESLHDRASLPGLRGRYDAINIKLDKAGGLTEALALADDARKLGLQIMVGCMVGTSLSMAPAMLVAQGAKVVDLDGPLLLARDREPGLLYDGSIVHPPVPALWG